MAYKRRLWSMVHFVGVEFLPLLRYIDRYAYELRSIPRRGV